MPARIVFAALILLPCLARAAEAPADFAGVEWGASPQQARSGLSRRGANETPKRSTATELFFEGGSFAGHNVAVWRLAFSGGKFTRGFARLDTPKADQERAFRAVKQQLNEKYGSGSDVQVGRRNPPHFVYGLGWRNSGATPPPLHAEWEITSGLKPRTIAIQLWVDAGQVCIAYANKAMDAGADSQGRKSDL